MARFHLVAALALALATSGCTRHHRVSQTELQTLARSGGHARRASGASISPGDPLFADELHSVKTVSHARGALEGTVVGALAGAGTGVIMGLAAGDSECGDPPYWCTTAGENAAIGGVVLGAGGAVLGLVVGALVGSKDVYERDPDAPPVNMTLGPNSVGLSVSF